MRAVVVALGKVGLPLAARIAAAGHEVVGCDVDGRVVEHEAFRAYVAGDDDAPIVPLEAGLETVLTAEAVLESARRGETVRLAAAR